MNKTQLVDVLAERLGDRRTAATAVEGLLETIVDTVRTGDSVTITGFGVFEARARAARTARNPRTGATVDVPATTVPAFRPGASFRTAVGGASAAGAAAPKTRATTARRAAVKATVSASGSFADPASSPKAAPAKAAKAAKADKPAKAAAKSTKAGAKADQGDKAKKAKSKK